MRQILVIQPSSVSGWRDLNSRPPVPQTGALPGCATSRCRGHWGRDSNPRRPTFDGGSVLLIYTEWTRASQPLTPESRDQAGQHGGEEGGGSYTKMSPVWSWWRDSNSRQFPYHGNALPTELHQLGVLHRSDSDPVASGLPSPVTVHSEMAWHRGSEGTRTPDPLLAKQTLYPLSYTPKQVGALARPHLGCPGFPGALTQAASVRGRQGSHVEKTGVEPVAFRVRGGRSSRTELHPLVVSITPELKP